MTIRSRSHLSALALALALSQGVLSVAKAPQDPAAFGRHQNPVAAVHAANYANLVPQPLPPIVPTHFGHNFFSRAIASHTPHHNGPDQIFATGEAQFVDATFAYGNLQVPLPNEKISLFAWSFSAATPQWVKIGAGKTNATGKLHFSLPATSYFPAGVTQVKAVVDGDATEANCFIQVMAQSNRTVVFDMDGTLTTDDMQVAEQFLSQLVDGTYVAKMIPGAADVANLYAQHGYTILYLSARPSFVGDISKQWLMDLGFPFGILHTTDQIIPLQAADAFKTAYLQSVTPKGYLLERGYGNAVTDITAYHNLGIAPDRTFIFGTNGGASGTVSIQGDYLAHVKDLESQL